MPKFKLAVEEQLKYASEELAAFLQAECETQQDLLAWCRRWGCTEKWLRRFIEGKPNALTPNTLYTISKDTGIPIDALILHSKVAGTMRKEVTLTPYTSGTGEPLRIMVLPRSQGVYKHAHDFRDNIVWLRAIEPVRIPPVASVEVWVPTGLKFMDWTNFVTDFHGAAGGDLVGRLKQTRDDIHVALLNLTFETKHVTMGERLGYVICAPRVNLEHQVYDVPEGYERAMEIG